MKNNEEYVWRLQYNETTRSQFSMIFALMMLAVKVQVFCGSSAGTLAADDDEPFIL
jgi:hypothetical protein